MPHQRERVRRKECGGSQTCQHQRVSKEQVQAVSSGDRQVHANRTGGALGTFAPLAAQKIEKDLSALSRHRNSLKEGDTEIHSKRHRNSLKESRPSKRGRPA